MSSNNGHICTTIKNNCINCNIYFKKKFNDIMCCFPIIETINETVELSNTDFNKERTPSMNDYIVNSYINDKSDLNDKTDLEVPSLGEKMDCV